MFQPLWQRGIRDGCCAGGTSAISAHVISTSASSARAINASGAGASGACAGTSPGAGVPARVAARSRHPAPGSPRGVSPSALPTWRRWEGRTEGPSRALGGWEQSATPLRLLHLK